ncbi:hypothetical protein GCM10010472_38810 [Pseudonocardia halophobica]|uniref:DUF742 domain-containing protein n=1 Tax=Pseudonocardia halophobica TaxID=29401 RepID=A0A9W6NVD1_9PSEU|nr:DUF742 domain-containing protein [Pseudonocardia halophobica]GLL11185.1 hypothetical protein GCM10017577_23260 [Pseudonocardia halophobica]
MTPADDLDIGFTGARFGGAPRKRRRKKSEEPAQNQPERRTADEADTAAMPVVGEAPAAPDPVADPAAAGGLTGFHEAPAVGYTGARFGGSSRRRRDRDEHPEPVPVAAGPVALPPLPPPAVEDVAEEYVQDDAGRSLAVRPYFYTKGRTRSRYELAIETLVSTPPAALRRPELAEHTAILELCREPRSIAEVGALMGMPLGVARVVVGDLAVTGGLEVHRTVTAEGPDLVLMERVLSGLRRL